MSEQDFSTPDANQIGWSFYNAPESDPAFQKPPPVADDLPQPGPWEVRGQPGISDPTQFSIEADSVRQRLEDVEAKVEDLDGRVKSPPARRRWFVAKITDVNTSGNQAGNGPAFQWIEQCIVNDTRNNFLPRQSTSYTDNSAAELASNVPAASGHFAFDPSQIPVVGEYVLLLEELDPGVGAYHYTLFQRAGIIPVGTLTPFTGGPQWAITHEIYNGAILPGFSPCIVVNTLQTSGFNGGTHSGFNLGTHIIQPDGSSASGPFWGKYLRMSDDQTVPVIEIYENYGSINCDMVQVGGADGNESTPATWTYDVYSPWGEILLTAGQWGEGGNIARALGKIKPATVGQFYIDASLYYAVFVGPPQVLCNEVPNYTAYTVNIAGGGTQVILSPT